MTAGFPSGVDPRYRYCVYGIVVVSDTPLALPEYSHGDLGQVECLSAPASVFLAATQGVAFNPRSDSWYRYAFLHDGSTYVRWDTVGEFLVAADGRRITCRRVEESSFESFQVYMLGQALSFALVKQGFEPLHATVVVVDDQAVAFLGDNAFGKSSLAACFLEAGYRLLTDDLLILPLDEHRRCAGPVPLKALYSLASPRDACRKPSMSLETLSPREAFVELVKGTFNRRLVSPRRLERQFGVMAALADRISVKKLTYPRAIDRLQEVRGMVLADLARDPRIARPAPTLLSGILV